jgi:ribosomal protein L7/L12
MSEPTTSATAAPEGKPTITSPPKETVTSAAPDAAKGPTKTAEPAAKEPVKEAAKEVNYDDLKVPDNTDVKSLKQYKEWAKGLGLNLDQAQKLYDIQRTGQETANKAQAEAIKKQMDDNIAALEADPKLGGENYDKTIITARRGLNALIEKKIVNDGFVSMLEKTGLHVNPDMVKILHYLGQMSSESKEVIGGSSTSEPAKSDWQRQVEAFAPPKKA